MVRSVDERRDRWHVETRLPCDDDPWLWIDGRKLVVSSAWGVQAPGAWIGAHANAVDAPIAGEFEFGVRVDEIDAAGKLISVLEQHRVHAPLSTDELVLFDSRLPDRAPALYRITITVLGQGFSAVRRTYLTVPDQVLQADLMPARNHARAGETLAFTLINDGPTSLFFGVDYRLQRHAGAGTWTGCNVEHVWTLVGHHLAPGHRFEQHAVLPDRAPPGRYRIRKNVSAVGTNLQRTLDFEFDITHED